MKNIFKAISITLPAAVLLAALSACSSNTGEASDDMPRLTSQQDYADNGETRTSALAEEKIGHEKNEVYEAEVETAAEINGITAAYAASADEYSNVYAEKGSKEGVSADNRRQNPVYTDEEYSNPDESPFKNALTEPLSTFSASPNTASYSNMRRYINGGIIPTGVRIEELINYFKYDYTKPPENSEHPFAINAEVAACPWNENNLLAMLGIQGEELNKKLYNNVVFLIDVSGSMGSENKLPLLQESFKLLVDSLDGNDIISIVTYAGSDKIVADSVKGSQKDKLKDVIDKLSAGGSTAGADGITTAYEIAEKNYILGGNNRVILATDGDFNVGISSLDGLTELIEAKKDNGVFISVLGFGMGNLKDSKMETIAKHGNGNYAYIDTIEEAKKVLVDEFDSTMYVIAKDLKLQVEFNPAVVKEYRLIGYDNRRLENEDFNNDAKDAGDIGAGFSVTAFYELIPAGGGYNDDGTLKYQTPELSGSEDYMTVKVRYKEPDGDTSILVEKEVGAKMFTNKPSVDFNFASAVAEFGLILTDSAYKGSASADNAALRAIFGLGEDRYGFRKEFVGLIEKYKRI